MAKARSKAESDGRHPLWGAVARHCLRVGLCGLIFAAPLLLIYWLPMGAALAADFLWQIFLLLLGMALVLVLPVSIHLEKQRTELLRLAALERAEEARHVQDTALHSAKERAEARSLAKSKYVRGISHELRTPLNAVLGYAQLLEASREMPEHLKHGVRVIRRSGDHLSSLVDGLLDISMIEAGRLQIYRDEVPFPAFLRQISDMFRLQAQEKGLEFVSQFPDQLPELVQSDEKRLRQILINLLSNALRCTEQGRIIFRVGFSGQVARFEVEDTGRGIAERDLQRIFQPFERLKSTMGTGLGLTITNALVTAMGGEITVSSQLGKGSIFSVRLLLSPVKAARKPVEVTGHIIGYEGRRRSILVVDDDPHHIGFMQTLLGGLGFDVMTAQLGGDGLKAARSQMPDMVLLDVSLPDRLGWHVAMDLRADYADLPIVMISADPRQETQRIEFEAAHDGYLIKPLRFAALQDLIGELMGLEWRKGDVERESSLEDLVLADIPSREDLAALQHLGQIGHIRGIMTKLDEIEAGAPQTRVFIGALRALARNCDLESYAQLLRKGGARHEG